jgi:hypothetical protein
VVRSENGAVLRRPGRCAEAVAAVERLAAGDEGRELLRLSLLGDVRTVETTGKRSDAADELAEESPGVDQDGNVGVGSAAPEAAPVDDRHASRERTV